MADRFSLLKPSEQSPYSCLHRYLSLLKVFIEQIKELFGVICNPGHWKLWMERRNFRVKQAIDKSETGFYLISIHVFCRHSHSITHCKSLQSLLDQFC